MLANRPAFSLVETLIVLTMMGVILAIGLPRLDPNRYRADAAAVLIR